MDGLSNSGESQLAVPMQCQSNGLGVTRASRPTPYEGQEPKVPDEGTLGLPERLGFQTCQNVIPERGRRARGNSKVGGMPNYWGWVGGVWRGGGNGQPKPTIGRARRAKAVACRTTGHEPRPQPAGAEPSAREAGTATCGRGQSAASERWSDGAPVYLRERAPLRPWP